MVWQLLEDLERSEVLSERPQTKPNPTIELQQTLADGTRVKSVWGYMHGIQVAKLVTVHFFDR